MGTTQLEVILRTSTGPNVHMGDRFVPFNKERLLLGCLYSLCRSIQDARGLADIRLTIIDDHSTSSAIAGMKSIVGGSGISANFVALPETGNRASIFAAYEYARKNARDLIYFVEDDYLHSRSAISEMLLAYGDFIGRLGGAGVGIFPVDYPDVYLPELITPTRIVLGKYRHWRTTTYTTGTMLVSKKLLLEQWYYFEALSNYGLAPEIFEGTSLNKIWQETNNFIFSPIPTLAIHMQFSVNIPPFTDWREWWNNYSNAPLR